MPSLERTAYCDLAGSSRPVSWNEFMRRLGQACQLSRVQEMRPAGSAPTRRPVQQSFVPQFEPSGALVDRGLRFCDFYIHCFCCVWLDLRVESGYSGCS